MLNSLPTYKNEILLIAHNSDYDCRFILRYLENVKPIVKSNRFERERERGSVLRLPRGATRMRAQQTGAK